MPEFNEEITIDVIKNFFDTNKDRPDVIEYLESIAIEKPLNVENVSAYLGTTEGKNLIQPLIDRANTQAIKTHDEKQRPIIEAKIKAGINEELARLNPTETTEQRQLREMRQEQEAMKSQWEKERLDNQIAMEAAKVGVPLELAQGIPYPSIDHFKNVALIWEQVKSKEVDKLVNERLATTIRPNSGQQEETGDPTKGMNPQQKFEYYKREAEKREIPVS